MTFEAVRSEVGSVTKNKPSSSATSAERMVARSDEECGDQVFFISPVRTQVECTNLSKIIRGFDSAQLLQFRTERGAQ
ncbi:hypothetical protein PUN28_004207 [Cardiocondyla obscurior]|uniref:Uncharacterized protein n=1 Tax=Cardiocondyla obscurior TaxID=286306 RepID=A0AAW2GQ03_9HYME